MGLWKRHGSEDEELEEMGEKCFMSHKGKGNRREEGSIYSPCFFFFFCPTGVKELAQALWMSGREKRRGK